MTNSNSEDLMAKVFDQSNLSARGQVTEWVKLKDVLGTKVAGFFTGFWEKPKEGVYQRQVSMALRDFKDENKVYGVTIPEYFEKELQRYELGDRVGAEYFKDIPPKTPGLSPTKAVRLFNLDLKEREKNGTARAVTPTTPSVDPEATTEGGSDNDDPGF